MYLVILKIRTLLRWTKIKKKNVCVRGGHENCFSEEPSSRPNTVAVMVTGVDLSPGFSCVHSELALVS